jgi:beta-mannosidase
MNPEYDDRDWRAIRVPANWHTEGVSHHGTAWYRTTFDAPETGGTSHLFLLFGGVDYYADAWVNGRYLGSHEGYFGRFGFDVTDIARAGTNHLAVKVESPTDVVLMDRMEHQRKSLIKGALQDWDANNLEVNTGGIYEDVLLRTTGPIRIDAVRVDCLLRRGKRSADITVTIDIVNMSRRLVTAEIDVSLAPDNFQGTSARVRVLAAARPGRSVKEIEVTLRGPALWWTWDLGYPHVYRAAVTAFIGADMSDRHDTTFGVRTIRKADRGWGLYLNGQRVFLRGTNYLSEQCLSLADAGRYDQDIALMRDAHMNVVRTFCNVERQHFYDACDRAGLLVYQDFPMQWEMADTSDLVRRAVAQTRTMVAHLYNHPSIYLWCFGSEPGRKNFEKVGAALVREARELDGGRIIHHANAYPDNWDYEEWQKKYGWDIDNHLYFGWYKYPYWPSLWGLQHVRRSHITLVSEYGAQALPSLDALRKFIPAEDLWPLRLKRYNVHGFQDVQQFTWIPEAPDLETLVRDSQAYQALVLRYHTEFYRMHKFRPCNGAIQFMFRDCWPAITWSVVDYYGGLKEGYRALQRAFRPLHVLMDWPRALATGRPMRHRIFVVNDLGSPLRDVSVAWTASAGEHVFGQGVFGAAVVRGSSLALIGTLHWTPPAGAAGRIITIVLTLRAGGTEVGENSYEVAIEGTPPIGRAAGRKGGAGYPRPRVIVGSTKEPRAWSAGPSE